MSFTFYYSNTASAQAMKPTFSAVLAAMTFVPNSGPPDAVLEGDRAFERRDGEGDDAADESRVSTVESVGSDGQSVAAPCGRPSVIGRLTM